MSRNTFWRLISLLVLLSVPLHGAEGWTQLKIGMTADEAVAALGEPLMRTSGQGLELWIYDHRAEVLFYGPLIGWSAPGSGKVAGTAVDIWQRKPGDADAPMFLLPRPPGSRKNLQTPVRRESVPEAGSHLPYYRRRS